MIRSFRYRLTPTVDQADQLRLVDGACRYVYNLALEQRRDWWRQYHRQTGYHFSFFGQTIELTALRRELVWLATVPRDPLDRALEELDLAYRAFFSGVSGYPSFRRRNQGCGFSIRGRDARVERLSAKWARVRIIGLGWFKFRHTREVPGVIKKVSIREVGGAWYVSLACEIEIADAFPLAAQVGIDRGVTNTLALSTGQLFQIPERIAAVDRRRKRAQRTLARRVKGSNRRAKQRARVAVLYARARRMRSDWLHRTTTTISRQFGLVAIEALNVRGMTASAAGTIDAPCKGVAQKRGLNRSILAQSWGQFERMLAYKLEAIGGALIRVPAAYTSQTCSACGAVDHRSRESQAVFRCIHCSHEAHADINAAKEILRRSTSELLVEGARQRPREARTTGVAA